VYSIAFHPLESNRIYIGTIDFGVYQTTDAGDSWFLMENTGEMTLRDVVFRPDAPETMFIGTTSGMYKSIDEGHTWSLVNFPENSSFEILSIFVHPLQNDLMFVGGGGPRYHYRSTDGGETWDTLAVPWVAIVDFEVDLLRPNTVYLATQSPAYRMSVFRSEDLGQTWHSVHNDLDTNIFLHDLAVDTTDSDIIYVCGEDFYRTGGACVAKTTDAGNHWFDVSPQSLDWPVVFSIAVSPNDHTTIFICTQVEGVFKSTDGGASWRAINNGLTSRTTRRIAIHPVTGDLYLGTYSDGIYRSTDGGESWLKISQNITNADCKDLAINPRSPDSLFTVTPVSAERSTDGGGSWQRIELSRPFDYVAFSASLVDPAEPDNVFLAFLGLNDIGGIFTSTDGGSTWQCWYDTLTMFSRMAIANFGSDSTVLYGALQAVYRSNDLGQSWERCEGGLPSNAYFYDIATSPADAGVVMAAANLRRLYRSSSSGESWELISGIPGSGEITEIKFHPANENVFYVCQINHGILKSTDGGISWTDITGNLPRYSGYFLPSGLAINPLNPENIYVNSFHFGIYVTHDGGQTWEDFNTGLRTRYATATTIIVPSDTNRMYLGTDEQSVWSIHRTIPDAVDDEPAIPGTVTLSAYPNPFNSSTVIRYNLGHDDDGTLSIYNITGQLIRSYEVGKNSTAPTSIIWDGTNQSGTEVGSGIYLARLKTPGSENTIKMLLIR